MNRSFLISISKWFLSLGAMLYSFSWNSLVSAETPVIGTPAPLFEALNHQGKHFSLASRKGKGWTVLFFYPKAETPGCTKQACAFRDSIKIIRALSTEVIGISSDTVEDQAAFHAHHQLQFDLLADPEGDIIGKYGTKIPVLGLSKRWTFILDPELRIRSIEKDVDPALDAKRVADIIGRLQAESTAPSTPTN